MAIVFKVKPWYKKSSGPTYQGIWVPKDCMEKVDHTPAPEPEPEEEPGEE